MFTSVLKRSRLAVILVVSAAWLLCVVSPANACKCSNTKGSELLAPLSKADDVPTNMKVFVLRVSDWPNRGSGGLIERPVIEASDGTSVEVELEKSYTVGERTSLEVWAPRERLTSHGEYRIKGARSETLVRVGDGPDETPPVIAALSRMSSRDSGRSSCGGGMIWNYSVVATGGHVLISTRSADRRWSPPEDFSDLAHATGAHVSDDAITRFEVEIGNSFCSIFPEPIAGERIFVGAFDLAGNFSVWVPNGEVPGASGCQSGREAQWPIALLATLGILMRRRYQSGEP